MYNVGDEVKINLQEVLETGLCDTEDQKNALTYIEEHPDEVYKVKSILDVTEVLAFITLDHPIVGKTSFFPEELIKILSEEAGNSDSITN